MSVHFDFTLSDNDAENIFYGIQTVINNNNITIQKLMCKEQDAFPDMTIAETIRYYRCENARFEALRSAIKYTKNYHDDQPDDVADITVIEE